MADLFSAISGAAGVVSLGLTACQGLVAYYTPFKSFSTETESFVTSVKGLSATLELLKSRINRLQNPVNPYVADELQLVADRINDCETALQHLSQTLKKCQGYDIAGVITRKGKAFSRAQYPFKRGTLVFLTQTVTGLQSNLDIALHALHLAMSHCIQEQNNSFLAVSQSIASDVATLPASLLHLHTQQQEMQQMITNIQQLKLTSIDQSTPRAESNKASLHRCHIPDRTTLRYHRAHTNTQSVGKDCTCTMTGSWLFRSSSILSRVRGHQFGCPKYYDREVTTVVKGKFTILNRFWGYSAYIGVQVIREDAGITISPTISIWPVVDNDSPAFRILYGIDKYENINDALAELRSLYNNGRASPRDTLPDGQTLIHLAVRVLPYLPGAPRLAQCCQFLKALVELSPVGLNQQSIFGGTVFDTLLHFGGLGILGDTDNLSSDVRALASLSRVLIDHGAVVTIESAIELPTYFGIFYHHYSKSITNYLFLPTVIDDCGAEEFPFSRLELSVLQRDEVAIAEILGRIGPDDRLTTNERCAYISAICWPRGLRIMLNLYVPESLQFLLHEAVVHRQFESAKIVMTVGKCYISDSLIEPAAEYYNPAIFEMLAANLAEQRRCLRQQACRLLSPSTLHDLGLSNSEGLLDSKAFEVETALGDPYKEKWLDWAEASNSYWAGSSVYHIIGSNVDAAKALYSQGFTDVNQMDVRGLVPLSASGIVSRDLNRRLEMCEWLLDKGASLQCPSLPPPWRLTPGHNVAYAAGEWLGQQVYSTTFDLGNKWSDEWEMQMPVLSEIWFTQCANHWTLLQQVFTDTQHRDGCLCACMSNGCLPLNVFLRTALRGCWHTLHGLPNSILGYIVAGIFDDHNPSAATTIRQLHDCMAPVAIRMCTFETLGLRHTCRYHHGPCPELGDVELDDIGEVQEEERFLINQLELLASEFEMKYRELCVSLPEFLRGYWAERMEEVLTEAFDEDEAHAMEEAGVVLDI